MSLSLDHTDSSVSDEFGSIPMSWKTAKFNLRAFFLYNAKTQIRKYILGVLKSKRKHQ